MSAPLTHYFWIFLTATAIILILTVGLIVGFLYWNKRLTEEQRLSATVLELMPVYILILAADGTVVRINSALENLLGLNADETVGRHFSKLSLLPTSLESHLMNTPKKSVSADLTWEGRYTPAKGNQRVIRWSINENIGELLKSNRIVLCGEDLTDLRELREKFHLRDALLQGAQSIGMVADGQGNIRYITPSVVQQLGFSTEELLGNKWWEHFDLPDTSGQYGDKSYVARAARGTTEIPDSPYTQKITSVDGKNLQMRWQDIKGPRSLLIRYGEIISEDY